MVDIGNVPIEEHLVDDLSFLWVWRHAAVRAPNIRLIDLARLDERVEAHLDALRVGGTFNLANRRNTEVGLAFVAASAAIVRDDAGRLSATVQWSRLADSLSAFPQLVSALAYAERNPAAMALEQMRLSAEPLARAVYVASMGARRGELGEALLKLAKESHSLTRARAYRTIGQLGRADLMAHLRPGLTDDDPECRFWSAWAAARMGAGDEALRVLADIAWNNLPRADRALDLLLRRLDVPQANAWLREFAKIPGRQRAVIRATGVIGDPLYIPWLIERMATPETARLAGEAFSMITGLDLAYRDLDRKPPQDSESGPNDDPADENVALDEDEYLPWPDPEKIGQWWAANRGRFDVGTPYFLGTPKPAANWLEALSDAFQRQRHAAALELAIRQPDKAMFEVRARGRLQRQSIARARGLA